MPDKKYITPELQKRLGANFWSKLVQISSEVGLSPEDLLVVMVSESGLDPATHTPGSNAYGLTQFMPVALSAVGWEGAHKDFTKLLGEEQLDYIKKLMVKQMQMAGGPFKSALQYYVANFWPVALRLPGIKSNDLSTAFIEENPKTVTDSQGKVWSKKYYDVGVKISPSFENKAYKQNPISKSGAITLGDMQNLIDRKKQNPIYLEALQYLKSVKDYKPQDVEVKSESSIVGDPIGDLESLEDVSKIFSVAGHSSNSFIIKISSNDFVNSVEFARVLSATLDETLLLKSFTHTDNSDVELEVIITGPKKESINAIKEVTSATIEAFKLATKKINSPLVKVSYSTGKSSLKVISLKTADINYRKFLLKFI